MKEIEMDMNWTGERNCPVARYAYWITGGITLNYNPFHCARLFGSLYKSNVSQNYFVDDGFIGISDRSGCKIKKAE